MLILLNTYTLSSDFYYIFLIHKSRDSSVGIATGYGLDDRGVGVRVPVGARFFSSPRCPDRFWSLPSFLSYGYQVVGRPKREADHSLPSSAEVKNTWSYISLPDQISGSFNWPNPSGRTMVLGSTQPLAEMSTRNLPGGKGRPAH
jgi:hypothetical protein